ncbi:unnamed protein product [Prorocentrum cordatum]|uniref:SAP domain-containing protein n=1 Tax=Prorocentrum cordatum TaxID=2364126 RepID=A0ABN9R8J8_9DINO|nr:unnamed protein product [Polarella glacialis]
MVLPAGAECAQPQAAQDPTLWVVAVPSYDRVEVLRAKTLKLLLESLHPSRIFVFAAPSQLEGSADKRALQGLGVHVCEGGQGIRAQRNCIMRYFQRHFPRRQRVLEVDDDLDGLVTVTFPAAEADGSKPHNSGKLVHVPRSSFKALVDLLWHVALEDHGCAMWGIYNAANPSWMSQRLTKGIVHTTGQLQAYEVPDRDVSLTCEVMEVRRTTSGVSCWPRVRGSISWPRAPRITAQAASAASSSRRATTRTRRAGSGTRAPGPRSARRSSSRGPSPSMVSPIPEKAESKLLPGMKHESLYHAPGGRFRVGRRADKLPADTLSCWHGIRRLAGLADDVKDFAPPAPVNDVDDIDRIVLKNTKWTVPQLRELCKERGCQSSGSKGDLIERLTHTFLLAERKEREIAERRLQDAVDELRAERERRQLAEANQKAAEERERAAREAGAEALQASEERARLARLRAAEDRTAAEASEERARLAEARARAAEERTAAARCPPAGAAEAVQSQSAGAGAVVGHAAAGSGGAPRDVQAEQVQRLQGLLSWAPAVSSSCPAPSTAARGGAAEQLWQRFRNIGRRRSRSRSSRSRRPGRMRSERRGRSYEGHSSRSRSSGSRRRRKGERGADSREIASRPRQSPGRGRRRSRSGGKPRRQHAGACESGAGPREAVPRPTQAAPAAPLAPATVAVRRAAGPAAGPLPGECMFWIAPEGEADPVLAIMHEGKSAPQPARDLFSGAHGSLQEALRCDVGSEVRLADESDSHAQAEIAPLVAAVLRVTGGTDHDRPWWVCRASAQGHAAVGISGRKEDRKRAAWLALAVAAARAAGRPASGGDVGRLLRQLDGVG